VSLELAALTLRHLYGDACPLALPIACGPAALRDDPELDAFLATMEHVLEGRRVLWWISAELSHAGPAYGRPALAPTASSCSPSATWRASTRCGPSRPEQLTRRCQDNDELLGRPSGAAALATVARLLPVGYRAELVDYATCTSRAPSRAGSGWPACASPGPDDDDDDD
jgi:hypothetical protein